LSFCFLNVPRGAVCCGARLCPAMISDLPSAQEEKDEEGRAADNAADSEGSRGKHETYCMMPGGEENGPDKIIRAEYLGRRPVYINLPIRMVGVAKHQEPGRLHGNLQDDLVGGVVGDLNVGAVF